MADNLTILGGEVGSGDDTVFQTADVRVLPDNPAEFFGEDLLNQCGNVGIVIIEGIPVDPALVGNIPDGDFAQRPL
jgi:hypothetical protein